MTQAATTYKCATATLVAAALLGLAACGDSGQQRNAAGDGNAPQAQQAGGRGGAQVTSVQVVPVERRQLQAWIYSQGTARSRQREFLTFTQPGVVTHIDERLRVGSAVKAGQVIAHQAPERLQADFQAARAAVAEADAGLALADVTLQRYETLIEQRSAAKQELDQARVRVQQARAARDNARARLAQAQLGVNESRLLSPINGVLARLNVEKGRYFMPGTVQTNTEQNALRTVPALVIDPGRFEVRVDLPAYEFRRLKVGAKAVIGGDAPPDGQDVDPTARSEGVPGQVHAVSPSLDPESRTFQVIVHTREVRPGLQDGEFVAVWISQWVAENALVVPLEALRFRNDQAFVFTVDKATGKVAERRVELGQQSGNQRAVSAGLEAGALVVTNGRLALHDGQQVHVLQRDGGGS